MSSLELVGQVKIELGSAGSERQGQGVFWGGKRAQQEANQVWEAGGFCGGSVHQTLIRTPAPCSLTWAAQICAS